MFPNLTPDIEKIIASYVPTVVYPVLRLVNKAWLVIFKRSERTVKDLIGYTIINDYANIIMWLRAQGCLIENKMLAAIVYRANNIVKWFYTTGLKPTDEEINLLVCTGNTDILIWLKQNNYIDDFPEYMADAMINYLKLPRGIANVDILINLLQWVKIQDATKGRETWTNSTFNRGLAKNEPELLDYLQQEGCEIVPNYVACIIKEADKSLYWLDQHGCTYNEIDLFDYLVTCDNVKILKWAAEKGIELDRSLETIRNLEVFKWYYHYQKQQGIQISIFSMCNMLQLDKRVFPISHFEPRSPEFLDYLVEQGEITRNKIANFTAKLNSYQNTNINVFLPKLLKDS